MQTDKRFFVVMLSTLGFNSSHFDLVTTCRVHSSEGVMVTRLDGSLDSL